MIEITETAQNSLQGLLDKDEEYIALRLVIHGDVPGMYRPELFIMRDGNQMDEDTIVRAGDLSVYIDAQSAAKAEGVKIDLLTTPYGPRLKFDFPSPVWEDPLAQRLQELIDRRINPSLMSHGGFIALVGVEDGVAEVIMGGGCQGCAMSAMTLSDSVEAIIKQEIPEIRAVVDRTNHAGGAEPYYRDEGEPEGSKSARRRASRKEK